MKVPAELLAAVEELLAGDPRGPHAASVDPQVTARLRVALECWLHGSMTAQQAIDLLRARTSSSR